jgi:hypothetical protein
MLAVAETAHSKLEVGPSPRCPWRRVSSTTVALLSHGCSSRRTISSPTRAVDFQWTRRRSSPKRYSRVATSSSPCTATERARLSPVPAYSPDRRTDGSGVTTGTTVSLPTLANERVSSHSPNGSANRTTKGPISYRPRTSARTV